MHELVIVLSDFYLAQDVPGRELPAGVALPGLQHAARFGTRSRVGGWRPWLAQHLLSDLPGEDLSGAAVAPVAAAALARSASSQASPSGGPGNSPALPTVAAEQPATVWMATPVHLVAGLTSVHLDRRSILRLSADDSTALASEFRRVFHDSGFILEPLDSGDFLLFGPDIPVTQTLEPARAMGSNIADVQKAGAAEPALRRLGAEIEMWLHEHPVNAARRRRGEATVTGLWMWGGGPAPAYRERVNERGEADAISDIAFGRDAYLDGLCASSGRKVFPLPQQLAEVFGYPRARRAALVIEIGVMLHSNPGWTFFDAVAQIDRAFLAPAVDALAVGTLRRLVILANDHRLTLRARDRFKLWRRMRPGLSGLQ